MSCVCTLTALVLVLMLKNSQFLSTRTFDFAMLLELASVCAIQIIIRILLAQATFNGALQFTVEVEDFLVFAESNIWIVTAIWVCLNIISSH